MKMKKAIRSWLGLPTDTEIELKLDEIVMRQCQGRLKSFIEDESLRALENRVEKIYRIRHRELARDAVIKEIEEHRKEFSNEKFLDELIVRIKNKQL